MKLKITVIWLFLLITALSVSVFYGCKKTESNEGNTLSKTIDKEMSIILKDDSAYKSLTLAYSPAYIKYRVNKKNWACRFPIL